MDIYINGYFNTNTRDKRLTEDMFCTDILASGNCNDIVKFYDGTVWNFFSDMSVDFQTKQRCIRMKKDYTIVSSQCNKPNHGMVCRLDCCKLVLIFDIIMKLLYIFNTYVIYIIIS